MLSEPSDFAPRRRVLFVRPARNPRAAPFLARIAGEMADALEHHCDVTIVDYDFDFDEVCDKVQPDFVLFDVIKWTMPFRLSIANLDTHPRLPRAIVLNIDPHEPLRPLSFETLDLYRIDTIFDRAGMCLRHMPELANKVCFSMPQFIDRAVFQDYGLEKSVPISIFSGHMSHSFYPWRGQVTADLPRIFPTLIYPHPGYISHKISPFAVEGEAYARAINRSRFSVADTARLDYVVRKHIEIPASGSILIAPNSEALGEYGFVDLENCILGSGTTLYDKIDVVSRDLEQQERIRLAGWTLAQSRYTRESWRVIPNWFECRHRLQPGETIVQQGLFGTFTAVPSERPPSVQVAARDNPMSAVLRAGRDAILTGQCLADAEAALVEAAEWTGHIAEPYLLLGVIKLLLADPVTAALLVGRRAQQQMDIMGDPTFALLDPVEVAWLLLAGSLLKHHDLVEAMQAQAASIDHIALRRMSWLLGSDQEVHSTHRVDCRLPEDRLSTHWLGQEDFADWKLLMHRIVAANGRPDLAVKLSLMHCPIHEASAA